MIDLYCERLSPGLWAEPVNALSNLAFLLAAYLGWRLSKTRQRPSAHITALIVLIAAIGIGSLLFHAFATAWALAADVIPILLFQIAYLWFYTGDVIGWRKPARFAALGALMTALLAGGTLTAYANGSPAYLPALITLSLLGTYHYRYVREARGLLLYASGLFALSLGLRTVDLAVCDRFAVGTHFAWHLLNAVVLYLVLRALLVALPAIPFKPHRPVKI